MDDTYVSQDGMDENDLLRNGMLPTDPFTNTEDFEDVLGDAVRGAKPLEEDEPSLTSKLVRLSTQEIFAPLNEPKWASKYLQIGPGRSACFAGYSFSGKTLVVQSLVLALCTGRSIWGQFRVPSPCRVWHIDQEQGRGTLRRYQRLLYGHDFSQQELDNRLDVSLFPEFWLSKTHEDVWCKECESYDVVVLDALRGLLLGVDENSSEVQDYIAKLTRVSEKTGVSFILIHHAGKGDPTCRDARELLRGSSGIFAALGSVFGLFGGATSEEPRLIKHLKSHPDAVGPTLDDFMLEIVDVPNGLNKFAGLHVGYRTIAEMEVKEDSYESVREAVLACLKDGPESCGMSATDIQREVKKRKSLVLRAIDDFSRAGTAKNLGTDRAPRWVYNADAKEARR